MWDLAGHGWGWVGVGLVHMLLLWEVIILAIVALVRFLSSSSKSEAGDAQKTSRNTHGALCPRRDR